MEEWLRVDFGLVMETRSLCVYLYPRLVMPEMHDMRCVYLVSCAYFCLFTWCFLQIYSWNDGTTVILMSNHRSSAVRNWACRYPYPARCNIRHNHWSSNCCNLHVLTPTLYDADTTYALPCWSSFFCNSHVATPTPHDATPCLTT